MSTLATPLTSPMASSSSSSSPGQGDMMMALPVSKKGTLTGWAFESWRHFRALLLKNFILFRRRWKSTLVHVLAPVLGVFLLYIANIAVDKSLDNSGPTVVTNRVGSSVKTLGELHSDNLGLFGRSGTVYYGPYSPKTKDIMMRLVKAEGLPENCLVSVNSVDDMADMWFEKVFSDPPLGGVFFSSVSPNSTGYSVYSAVNQDTEGDFQNSWNPVVVAKRDFVEYDQVSMAFQIAVDSQIIASQSGMGSEDSPFRIKSSMKSFPLYAAPGMIGDDTDSVISPKRGVRAMAPVVLFTSVMIPFIIVVHLLMLEKQAKVVGMMRVIGLKEGSYWVSWFVSLMAPTFVFVLLCYFMGLAASVDIFKRTNFFVLFFSYFVSCCGLNALACAVSSPYMRPRYAYAVSFFVIAIGLVISLVFAIGTISLGIYDDSTNMWGARQRPTFMDRTLYDPHTGNKGLLSFLEILPPFHFVRIMEVFASVTSNEYYNDQFYQTHEIPGEHMGWEIFNHGRIVSTCCDEFGSGYSYRSGAPRRNILLLLANCLLYVVLAWYGAQISDTGNGAPKKWYFFLTPDYWGLRKADEIVEGDTLARVRDESLRDGSIRLHKVSKTFKDSTALKELSMEIRPGEVFALLGENGAGKSTTINIITGQTSPTHGRCFVNGLSVEEEMDSIRPSLGLTPQDDLIWADMSAEEHLRFYMILRGVPSARIPSECRSLLKDVGLYKRASSLAGTFSGGMKRRLSFAISCVSSPGIIILDEPSTGLDPIALRRMWNVISRLKKGRIVILTTHSLEEADALGDRIAFVASGALRAIGSPVFLKNRFGSGFLSHLVCTDPSRTQELKDIINRDLPHAEILDSSAGSLAVTIPRGKAGSHVPALFKIIDTHAIIEDAGEGSSSPSIASSSSSSSSSPANASLGGDLIKEWGVSESTLEEVFLKLAGESHEVNEEIDEKVSASDVAICKLCRDNVAGEAVLWTSKTPDALAVLTQGLICENCCPKLEENKKEK